MYVCLFVCICMYEIHLYSNSSHMYLSIYIHTNIYMHVRNTFTYMENILPMLIYT